MQSNPDEFFITKQERVKSGFEKRYLERCYGAPEFHTEIPGFSPEIVQVQEDFMNSQGKLDETRAQHDKWMIDHKMRENKLISQKENFEQIETNEDRNKSKIKSEIDAYSLNCKYELDLIEKYEKELIELKKKEKDAKNRLEVLEEDIRRLEPSVLYLDQLLDDTKIFEGTEQMLQRFHDLTQLNEYFNDEEESLESFTDPKDLNLWALLSHLRQELIEKHHKLISFDDQITSTHTENRYVVQENMKIEEKNLEKEIDIAEIASSLDNISKFAFDLRKDFALLGESEHPPTHLDAQLDLIEIRFDVLKQIIEKYQP